MINAEENNSQRKGGGKQHDKKSKKCREHMMNNDEKREENREKKRMNKNMWRKWQEKNGCNQAHVNKKNIRTQWRKSGRFREKMTITKEKHEKTTSAQHSEKTNKDHEHTNKATASEWTENDDGPAALQGVTSLSQNLKVSCSPFWWVCTLLR